MVFSLLSTPATILPMSVKHRRISRFLPACRLPAYMTHQSPVLDYIWPLTAYFSPSLPNKHPDITICERDVKFQPSNTVQTPH